MENLTKEDLLMLCEESRQKTETGKLALISLLSIVNILEEKSSYFYNKALHYRNELFKWRTFFYLSLVMCIYFFTKIPIYHILFWINLAFPIIGFLCLRYCKVILAFYTKSHTNIAEYVHLIYDALGCSKEEE